MLNGRVSDSEAAITSIMNFDVSEIEFNLLT